MIEMDPVKGGYQVGVMGQGGVIVIKYYGFVAHV